MGPADRRLFLAGAAAAAAAGVFAPPALAGLRRLAKFDWTLHQPESLGMSRTGLERVNAYFRQRIERQELTGAVYAIGRYNRLVGFDALGVRNVESREPMRKDDIFRMMSNTKVATAVATLMMLDAGRLSIEDRVSRFIPSFRNLQVIGPDGQLRPMVREVTIRDLLTHTSGLGTGGAGEKLRPLQRKPGDTLADYVDRLGSGVLDFQPGSKFAYSGIASFDTLLRIVELTSGVSGDAFLRERVFQPLEMRDTHFNLPPEKANRLLTLYARKDGAWRPQQPLFDNATTTYFSGAGGLVSTTHDYMQLHAMLYNKGSLNGRRILKESTVELMSQNHIGDLYAVSFDDYTVGMGFGLGVKVAVRPSVNKHITQGRGSFGWSGAYGTECWVDPENDLTVVYMVQQPSVPGLIDFQRVVSEAVLNWREDGPRPTRT
jgi:CubicO group peptidase (beta-lactamase class C family)